MSIVGSLSVFLDALAGIGLAYAGQAAAQARGPRNKLVVVIARGAMDGLSVTVPHADPNYRNLRGSLAIGAPGQTNGALALDDSFGHPPGSEQQAIRLEFNPAARPADCHDSNRLTRERAVAPPGRFDISERFDH